MQVKRLSQRYALSGALLRLSRSGLALSVTFGDSSPKGGATGVPVRPTRDEQSLLYPETVVPCYRDSQQLDKGYCPEAAALCSRALFFAPYWAFSGQRRVARHASASPYGRGGIAKQ